MVQVEPVNAQGAATGGAVWSIVADPDANGVRNNLIDSGVIYGSEPRFVTTGVQATPLQIGQRYRVSIGMTGPASIFGFEAGGAGYFTP